MYEVRLLSPAEGDAALHRLHRIETQSSPMETEGKEKVFSRWDRMVRDGAQSGCRSDRNSVVDASA